MPPIQKSIPTPEYHLRIPALRALIDTKNFDALFAQRNLIKKLAESDDPQAAATAFAALMTVDGYVEPAWELAWSSSDGFADLLAAMPLLTDAHLRIELADRSLLLLDDDSLSLLSGWPPEQRLAARKAIIMSLPLVTGREEEFEAALVAAQNDPALNAQATRTLHQIAETATNGSKATSRKFQQKHELTALESLLDWPRESRSFARGRRVYHELGCQRCHILSEHDTLVGPNLWNPDYKPTRKELAEAIIYPDKEIADDYRQYMLVSNGMPITGLVTEQTPEYLIVIADPMHDCTPQRIERDELDDDPEPLTTSAMPTGMVDVLSMEELLDLLAYVDAKGDPKNPSFRHRESP